MMQKDLKTQMRHETNVFDLARVRNNIDFSQKALRYQELSRHNEVSSVKRRRYEEWLREDTQEKSEQMVTHEAQLKLVRQMMQQFEM